MSANKLRHMNPQDFPTDDKIKGHPSKSHKKNIQSLEIEHLKGKIAQLQNALCIAIDNNDELRSEVALLEATLDFAKTQAQEKDETILRLRAIIAKSQFIDKAEDKEHDRRKSL